MTRSHLWKFLFILLTISLAVGSILPIRPRNLIAQFEKAATEGDTNSAKLLDAIVLKARELDTQRPNQTYSNLLAAIGDTDLVQFFPKNYVDYSQSVNPNRTILNRVQRDAGSKFRLGIDLQGGTSFQLELDPTKGGKGTTNGMAARLNDQQLTIDLAAATAVTVVADDFSRPAEAIR